MSPTLWFIVLCGAAFLLFALEVFIPDFILAAVGAMCLIGACVMAFVAFSPATAGWISVGLVTGTLTGFVVWLLKMPDSPVGKKISLATSLQSSSASEAEPSPLIGKTGTAETALMPGGYARIDGKRMDVVCAQGFAEAGTDLTVVEVHGNRIVVKKTAGAPA
jgi:membrane-bound ClpP family serine protease